MFLHDKTVHSTRFIAEKLGYEPRFANDFLHVGQGVPEDQIIYLASGIFVVRFNPEFHRIQISAKGPKMIVVRRIDPVWLLLALQLFLLFANDVFSSVHGNQIMKSLMSGLMLWYSAGCVESFDFHVGFAVHFKHALKPISNELTAFLGYQKAVLQWLVPLFLYVPLLIDAAQVPFLGLSEVRMPHHQHFRQAFKSIHQVLARESSYFEDPIEAL
jgi:hypothetical protein